MTENVQDTYKAATGTGWVTFAAILFLIGGVFHIIDGIAALAKNNQLSQHGQLFFNLTFWGVVWLIVGALALYAGYALLSGTGGRSIGIFLASLAIIGELMFLNVYPFWSLIMCALWFMIIYALIVQGQEETA